MIIFDLDTLADDSHRRHFIDPIKAGCIQWVNLENGKSYYGKGYKDGVFNEFQPDYQAYWEACGDDKPIWPTIQVFEEFKLRKWPTQIWSTRCESLKEVILSWIKNWICCSFNDSFLKMRPIGNTDTEDTLKWRWLDDHVSGAYKIDFIFDSDPESIAMFRRRGIFVFDCRQS